MITLSSFNKFPKSSSRTLRNFGVFKCSNVFFQIRTFHNRQCFARFSSNALSVLRNNARFCAVNLNRPLSNAFLFCPLFLLALTERLFLRQHKILMLNFKNYECTPICKSKQCVNICVHPFFRLKNTSIQSFNNYVSLIGEQ